MPSIVSFVSIVTLNKMYTFKDFIVKYIYIPTCLIFYKTGGGDLTS